jgi:hypothetical protein
MSGSGSIGEIMSTVKVEDGADLGGHVVALNNLMTSLSKETRPSYKPDYKAIENIAHSMKMHASAIESMMKREQK